MCTHYTQVNAHGRGRVAAAPLGSERTRLDDLLSSADGVGDDQQSGLRCSHVPQHERLGFGVEAGYLLSLQLLTQVSTPGSAVRDLVNSVELAHPVTTGRAAGLRPTLAALFCAEL